jgi:hypothetical protein
MQHLVVIHTELPTSIRSEQILDGRFCNKPAITGDIFIVPATVRYKAQWDREGCFNELLTLTSLKGEFLSSQRPQLLHASARSRARRLHD